jgi:putative oxidoreductase
MKFLENYQEQAYALLRITAGFMFLLHGTQKFFNFPQQYPYGELGFLSIAAGSIELIGGVLIILGLTTRGAAFLCSGTMAVAYWLVHGTKSFYPLVNGGELAALYCFIFLFIACKGSGIWSMDNK